VRRTKRQTLSEIVETQLRGLVADLARIRRIYPKELWKVNDAWAIEQRAAWLRDAILIHFRQYASEQESVTQRHVTVEDDPGVGLTD